MFASLWSIVAVSVAAIASAFQDAQLNADDTLIVRGATANEFVSYDFYHANATFVSVHFASLDIPVGGLLTIHSPDGSTRFSYSNVSQADFYAESIEGDTAVVTYTPPKHATDGVDAFVVDKFAHGYIHEDGSGEPEGLCGIDTSKAAVCLNESAPIKYEKSKTLARLVINRRLCTGWLFGSEGHVITNHHCIANASDASNTQVEFGAECATCDEYNNFYQMACKGSIVATTTQVVYTSAEHDFTLVQLNLKPGVSLAKYGYLQARASGPVLGESIYIPQHPNGKPRRIAHVLENNLPGTIESLNFPDSCLPDEAGHSLNTEGGSSGSPVLSTTDNTVVALHNCGGCATLSGAIKIEKVIADLTKANLLPKNAIAGSAPVTTPTPSTPTPTPAPTFAPKTPAPTPSPMPSPTPVPTSKTLSPTPSPTPFPTPVPTSKTPSPTPSPTTAIPTPAPTTVAPVTRAPANPSPTTDVPTTPTPSTVAPGACRGCKGCYSSLLSYCFPTGYSKAQCISFVDFKAVWCGN
ncbi:Aste57867_6251 [Aphanomyces stellatus]|uniref:Aste57867_6251 protein n=1 Tax=Aphanomyces stellatus TaxID=120398 RepID=A0A485KHS1_9STRA|nr:hypothetical protein As57867_006237 [Aphanomyces stellatus]VFT83250.1 Aste57867_6251 [Aphanomyces stellatus]